MYVKHALIRHLLQGHLREAMAVQGIVLFAELILVSALWWMPRARPAAAVCVLLFDVLLLSPLKAGRAAYFYELTERGTTSSATLWQFYTHRYEQSVTWRLLTWSKRFVWSIVFYAPAVAVFVCSKLISDTASSQREVVLAMLLFGIGLILVLFGAMTVEILLFQLAAVPYLLTRYHSLREATAVSKRCMKGRSSEFALFYIDHAYGCLLSIFLFPWFYTSVIFQTAKATAIRKFLAENSGKNVPYRLQHQKKCDRMGK